MTDEFINKLKKIHFEESNIDKKQESKIDLNNFNKSHITSIKESIEEIKHQVNDREILRQNVLKRLDSLVSAINNLITQRKSEIDVLTELQLIKETREVEKLKLEEELNSWRDKARLKEEFREHLKELRELELKSEELDRIMN